MLLLHPPEVPPCPRGDAYLNVALHHGMNLRPVVGIDVNVFCGEIAGPNR